MLIIDQLKKGDRELHWLALGVLSGLGILLVGLFYVQGLSATRFKASQVNQSFRTIRLPAVRGRILDARGVPLAENRPLYNVNLYLDELRPQFQAAFGTAAGPLKFSRQQRAELGRRLRFEVASNLVGQASAALRRPTALNEAAFHAHYDERLALPLPVFPDLTLEQVSLFVEQAATLPGLELEVQPLRAYPQHTVAAHLVGYLQRHDRPEEEDFPTRYSLPDYTGVVGIESVFDKFLRGKPGIKSVLVNNLGYRQSENVWATAEAGQNVILTIDVNIQRAAETALSTTPSQRGAALVMDPNTGDLLALASSPSFDPNRFLPRMKREEWAALQLDLERLPLVNRATFGTYPPGSIFKIVIALAALEAGIIDPQKLYHSPGYYLLGKAGYGRKIKDTANGGQPASFDFKRALKQSSNAYFIHYGLLAGLDDIVRIGQRLHLGERTGIPIGQETGGVFPSPAWREKELGGWFEGDTANLCIGQGYIAVTPLQMAVMTAAVANGGKVLWPRLVARVEPQDPLRANEGISFPSGRVRDQLRISKRTLNLVREAMLGDVEDDDGTGRKARVEGMKICAKTGTAQLKRPGHMDHITWFVSFAPFDQPRYVVVVMVESGVSGAETCAPLAQQIYLAIQRREAATPSLARSN